MASPMKRWIVKTAILSGIMCLCLGVSAQNKQPTTWINPTALNYRFSENGLGYREAADPVVHLFKGLYYLYASKSGGYWYSEDLCSWQYRPSVTLPVKDYAPAVMSIRDTVFYTASGGTHQIYYSLDPRLDDWKVYNAHFALSVTDPDLFLDDDGRVYFYYGCSDKDPIMGVELNRHHLLDTIGVPQVLIRHNIKDHGWESPAEDNLERVNGWNEGPWMTKYNGKYYLQYASPGTQFKVYADGVYESDRPLGPFTYMENSPFSYKPKGFIGGAGHGATFKDKYGNYWHIATMSISVRHMFERRLGIFPAFFDKSGLLHCVTGFGDYPQKKVTGKIDFEHTSIFTGWMLLSYHKKVMASSSLPDHGPELAVNEDIRNWWSAASGKKGEWLSMDLGHISKVQAIQINFADQDANLKDTDRVEPYRYQIEGSKDGTTWQLLADKSNNQKDLVDDYIELSYPQDIRYLKITNIGVPAGKFSVSGFRVFGTTKGKKPDPVKDISVLRNTGDLRSAVLSWTPSKGATGYLVKYGIAPGILFHSAIVYGEHQLELNGLNTSATYYFKVDAFNESGVTDGK
ncbi:F5/8 type C domain-containing protein [Arachidicoccus rhizosphaerae]|uniref:F5/8 type C domain-containing protein n=1 Tax=Arachidicoccus rhizosphaerae TaxID=551991 RepID=A0A1H3XSM1_9BACT|nr:family 43 glycosylhydrolase [Arachidicoccus rhizosphaerae]SEA02323.1 F5/8 type C domain-containing protein [Arachidicoccus rhizosphaerae]